MNLSESNWYFRVWRLAGPMILANVTIPLLGAVDTAVIGHLPNPAYLGGVAVGAIIISMLTWMFGFLRMGTTGLTAQAYGAADSAEVRSILGRAVLLSLIFGAVMLASQAGLWYVAEAIVRPSADVAESANAYFSVRVWSIPAVLMTNALIGWLLGVQRAELVLIYLLFLNGLNICLDVVFVVVLDWDVRGVAGGTAIAEWSAVLLGAAMTLRVLRRQYPGEWDRHRLFDLRALRRLVWMNADLMVRSVCLEAMTVWFISRGARLGDLVLAANAVLMNFHIFAAFALDGFANAAEALVGHAKGAGDRPGFRRAVGVSTTWAVAWAIGYAIAFLAAGGLIIGLLTDIPDVREEAEKYLPWVAAMPFISVFSFQLDGIFIGATRTTAMRNSMFGSLVVFVTLSAVLVPFFGNHGLWAAMMGFMAARTVSLGVRYPALARSIGRPVSGLGERQRGDEPRAGG